MGSWDWQALTCELPLANSRLKKRCHPEGWRYETVRGLVAAVYCFSTIAAKKPSVCCAAGDVRNWPLASTRSSGSIFGTRCGACHFATAFCDMRLVDGAPARTSAMTSSFSSGSIEHVE